MAPHLVVDISFHGFGHLAQIAPVLQELRARLGKLRLTARSTIAEPVLRSRLGEDLRVIRVSKDVGMRMASALDVLPEDSTTAYRLFHRDWTDTVRREAQDLEALSPDLVVANVPYLTLAAAALARIPSVAMCSLNWADIYHHYCRMLPDSPGIHDEMVRSYLQADLFLQPSPHMPMENLPRRKSIGPVAQMGMNRRDEMAQRLGIHAKERFVLVGLGGIATRLSVERWPVLPDTRWLVPGDWQVERCDCSSLESLDMPFLDVLASSDVLIAKPGYGAFVEAACHGLPVLYVARKDWPEEPYLTAWLHQYGRALEASRRDLETGQFASALEALLEQPAPAPVRPTGVDETADILVEHLNR